MHTKRKVQYPWKWMIAGVLIALLVASAPVFAEGEVPEEFPAEAPPAEEVAPPEEEAEPPPEEADLLPEMVVPEVAVETKTESICVEPLEGDPWFKIGTTTYR